MSKQSCTGIKGKPWCNLHLVPVLFCTCVFTERARKHRATSERMGKRLAVTLVVVKSKAVIGVGVVLRKALAFALKELSIVADTNDTFLMSSSFRGCRYQVATGAYIFRRCTDACVSLENVVHASVGGAPLRTRKEWMSSFQPSKSKCVKQSERVKAHANQ